MQVGNELETTKQNLTQVIKFLLLGWSGCAPAVSAQITLNKEMLCFAKRLSLTADGKENCRLFVLFEVP